MVITAKCAHCGAQIVFGETDEVTVCKYCDSVNAIPDVIKKNNDSLSFEEPILREVLPELKFAANHEISDMNAQGGHIWITKNELYFKPHKLNVGDLAKRYIRIQDICGYEKGALTGLTIYTKKGYRMKLVVWKKDEIINALETRRRIYYETRNVPVPPLSNGTFNMFSDEGAVEANVLEGKEDNNGIWYKIAIGIVLLWILVKLLS